MVYKINKETLSAIADKIREKTNSTDKLLPGEFPAAIEEVYHAGYDKGKSDVGDNYYDTFWDCYQENGARLNYVSGFAGAGWNNNTFIPKYDISKATTMQKIFSDARIGDLSTLLQSMGRTLDFSKASNVDSAFAYSWITRVPDINVTKAGANCRTMFSNCNRLHTIDKLMVAESNISIGGAFQNCTALQNLTIEGTIATTIDLHWSPLTQTSILSVLGALSTNATGQTCIFNTAAVDAAFETSEGANDGSTSAEWIALVDKESPTAIKPNWSIGLS